FFDFGEIVEVIHRRRSDGVTLFQFSHDHSCVFIRGEVGDNILTLTSYLYKCECVIETSMKKFLSRWLTRRLCAVSSLRRPGLFLLRRRQQRAAARLFRSARRLRL